MGSITVVQQFEFNVVPLKVLISMDFINALIDFFDPAALRTKKNEEVLGGALGAPLCMVCWQGEGDAHDVSVVPHPAPPTQLLPLLPVGVLVEE
jgi:hypothetical protein